MAFRMSENWTPEDAARTIAEASRYEGALAERTGGLTWMVWGLVSPAIFLTYALAEAAAMPPGAVWGLLWAPWVAGGVVATATLWRSAALAAPSLRTEPAARIWSRWLAATAAIVLAMMLAPRTGANEPLVIIGLFWVAMGGLNLIGAPPRARVVAVASGAMLLVGALGLALSGIAGLESAIFAAALSGVVPFVAGILHAFRG
jgi:hypothetical protein